MVNYAGKYGVDELSMSKQLLAQVRVHSEDILELLAPAAIPNFMPINIIRNPYIRTTPARRRIKVAYGCFKPCYGALIDALLSMGELISLLNFV